MSQTILLTAANEDSEKVLTLLSKKQVNVFHAPLEVYAATEENPSILSLFEEPDSFPNIVHSCKRNASFFMKRVEAENQLEAIKSRLNIAFDELTFELLESYGIPAIHPPNGSKAIDVVELMLRLQRTEATLYPCGTLKREDFPGLLEELDMEVKEVDVFELQGPSNEDLEAYQKKVHEKQPDTIIFHSRRSVTRTLAAFPDLDYKSTRIISADTAITQKLKDQGFSVDEEAEGSWESIGELIG